MSRTGDVYNLGQICRDSELSKNLKARLMSSTRSLISVRYKFTVVYCESVNLIGYITVSYLLIVNSYASVHIAHHV